MDLCIPIDGPADSDRASGETSGGFDIPARVSKARPADSADRETSAGSDLPAAQVLVRLKDHARLLHSCAIVKALLPLLHDCLAENGCTCESYCFHVDELRMVISATRADAKPREAFLAFKAASAGWFRYSGFPGWEQMCYVRPLKSPEERLFAIYEVLGYAALRGSSEKARQYPFVGSLPGSREG